MTPNVVIYFQFKEIPDLSFWHKVDLKFMTFHVDQYRTSLPQIFPLQRQD